MVRRLAAIFLLLLILFNVIGYYGVYLGLRAKANNELIEHLDANNFDESKTIAIKIPLSLPYASDWSGFQRVDGEFEKDGKFYNLVKQKIERDTLTVIAVEDYKEATLFESLTEFVHASTDTPLSKKAGKMFESVAKDFLPQRSELIVESVGWYSEAPFVIPNFTLLNTLTEVHTPPPRA